MSATNKTPHLNLNLWAAADAFLREDFNQDHRTLDAAFAGLPNVRCAAGQYQGTSSAKQAITVGFRPKLVIAIGKTAQSNSGLDMGFFLGDLYLTLIFSNPGSYAPSASYSLLTADDGFTDNGFTVKTKLNISSMTYRYIAIG